MASSAIVPCPKDVWTKVATGVTKGRIEAICTPNVVKYYAAVPTGDPAPTEGEQDGRITNAAVVDGGVSVDLYCYPESTPCQIRTITIL